MRNLQRLRRLPADERWLLLRAWLLLPLMGRATHLLGLRRTLAVLRATISNREAIEATQRTSVDAGSVARLVRIAAGRGPYHATCLPQALTLWWLLRHRGFVVDLRIGVRKKKQELLAHAWVEYDGRALGDDGDLCGTFTAFEDLDRALIGRAP